VYRAIGRENLRNRHEHSSVTARTWPESWHGVNPTERPGRHARTDQEARATRASRVGVR
jgi:hypothetical protein